MSFPDPSRPIATCSATSCTGCPVSGQIHCHFQLTDYLYFLLISLPGFIIAGAILLEFNSWVIATYLFIVVGFFGFLEIRVMCSHCPHYAEKGRTLTCWANHGSPKLWKYRPGPVSTMETFWFFAGLLSVWLYPLPFLVVSKSWLPLSLYIITSTAFFTTLKLFLCKKCINFACPLNGVPPGVKELFFQRNESVARHWPKNGTGPDGCSTCAAANKTQSK